MAHNSKHHPIAPARHMLRVLCSSYAALFLRPYPAQIYLPAHTGALVDEENYYHYYCIYMHGLRRGSAEPNNCAMKIQGRHGPGEEGGGAA